MRASDAGAFAAADFGESVVVGFARARDRGVDALAATDFDRDVDADFVPPAFEVDVRAGDAEREVDDDFVAVFDFAARAGDFAVAARFGAASDFFAGARFVFFVFAARATTS